MNPRIGRRSLYNKREPKTKPAAVEFVEQNTKKNISMKEEFLYLEDVKTAMNIHHLEVHIKLKQWLLLELKKNSNVQVYYEMLSDSIDKDRHRLQKEFRITLK